MQYTQFSVSLNLIRKPYKDHFIVQNAVGYLATATKTRATNF